MGLNYLGVADFPSKHFFWCSSANWTFALLPEVQPGLPHIFDKIQVFFSGEFDKILIDSNGKSEVVDVAEAHSAKAKPLELPSRGITELDRLSYVVRTIEADCQTIPMGSFKHTPTKEVRRNEAFQGLRQDKAFDMASY